MTSTRWLRATLSASLMTATALAGAVLFTPLAQAGAPMVKTPAPGFYRMMVGDFEVTALSDGTVALPVDKLLTNTTPGKVGAALGKSFLKPPVETSVNAYLVNTGDKLVLVDTGASGLFGPTLGNLLANLKAAGYQPEQVDAVVITHMHADHVGGLMSGGQMAFPNATVHADQRDADFWLSTANMEKAPAESKGFFQGAMASLNPYVAAGRFKPFNGNTDLLPGIKAQAAHGHTPGHSTFVIESKGQKMVMWGDLMHVAAVQFEEPSVTITFDSDSKAAAVQRKKAYADAAKNGYWVAATHLSFPGIGHIRRDGARGYRFVPANYSIVR